MDVVNPANNELIESYEEDSSEDVEGALSLATDAFEEWRDVPLREREELVASAGEVLRDRKREWAE